MKKNLRLCSENYLAVRDLEAFSRGRCFPYGETSSDSGLRLSQTIDRFDPYKKVCVVCFLSNLRFGLFFFPAIIRDCAFLKRARVPRRQSRLV